MADQRRERVDALADLTDLEMQLQQTQVYNKYMARELHTVRGPGGYEKRGVSRRCRSPQGCDMGSDPPSLFAWSFVGVRALGWLAFCVPTCSFGR